MTDEPRPKERHWFQFHLSTLTVVGFAAGGLAWLNCAPSWSGMALHYGWPWEVLYQGKAVLWHAGSIVADLGFAIVALSLLARTGESFIRRHEAATGNGPCKMQVHLSTAVILMFVASGLLWLSLSPRTDLGVDNMGSLNVLRIYSYGWPKECYGVVEELDVQATYFFDTDGRLHMVFPEQLPPPASVSHHPSSVDVAGDAGVALAVLVLTCWICEWRIRRRNRRNAPGNGQ